MSKPVLNVALALVARGDRWLVAKRRHGTHLGGLWEFPGGKRLPHESPARAAIRELWEECAVRATPEHILPQHTWEYDDRIVHLTPIICRWIDGEAHPHSADVCRWVSADELPQLEMPAVNAAIIRALSDHARPT